MCNKRQANWPWTTIISLLLIQDSRGHMNHWWPIPCIESAVFPHIIKALPWIIPTFLIMSTPGTLLCRLNLVISNNAHSHGLRTPGEEITFTEWPKIHSHSQIFRYSQSIFCTVLSATSAQIFRFLWFMPSLGVLSLCLKLLSKLKSTVL